MAVILGHCLKIIKWTWGLFSQNLEFDSPIWKITTGQVDDYSAICLLEYYYFSKYYKRIAINLSKQQALDAGPKAMQQIDLTGNLAQDLNANTTIFFFIEEVKKTFS